LDTHKITSAGTNVWIALRTLVCRTDTVTADRRTTLIRTIVDIYFVAIVTLLRWIDDTIATGEKSCWLLKCRNPIHDNEEVCAIANGNIGLGCVSTLKYDRMCCFKGRENMITCIVVHACCI
jgi:hypothetical protein